MAAGPRTISAEMLRDAAEILHKHSVAQTQEDKQAVVDVARKFADRYLHALGYAPGMGMLDFSAWQSLQTRLLAVARVGDAVLDKALFGLIDALASEIKNMPSGSFESLAEQVHREFAAVH